MPSFIRVAKGEPVSSVIRRFVRSVWRLAFKRHSGANHYCPGDSGSGAWCFQSEAPCRCGYCGKPSKALRDE